MHSRAAAASAEWITDDHALAATAADWGRVIGLDTEFQRTDTFFPIPGLYQVSAGADVWFLDPLTLSDLGSFLEVLEDRRTIKIMHACSEDLEVLRHHFGAVPRGLFDTQVANAFVSPDFSVSFTRLVASELGIVLEQSETRSDWLARPLTPAQERYAWEDVHYLPPLHDALTERLARVGRLEWLREEMDRRARFVPADPEQYYLSVKRAGRMDGPTRSRLQALCAWRERYAMVVDRPRNRVIRDDTLVELAQVQTLDARELERHLPGGAVRRFGDEILAAHAAGSDNRDHPPPPDGPLGSAAQGAVSAMREVAQSTATALGMAPELLGRRRDVEACVRHYVATGELTDLYAGWRGPVLADAFRRCLDSARLGRGGNGGSGRSVRSSAGEAGAP